MGCMRVMLYVARMLVCVAGRLWHVARRRQVARARGLPLCETCPSHVVCGASYLLHVAWSMLHVAWSMLCAARCAAGQVERRKVHVDLDYVGFTCPDAFVVGFAGCYPACHICTGTLARPCYIICTGADPAHICTGTGGSAATSAPGLASPLPHLHRDWAHACHICIGTGLARCHICTGTLKAPAGMGSTSGRSTAACPTSPS